MNITNKPQMNVFLGYAYIFASDNAMNMLISSRDISNLFTR